MEDDLTDWLRDQDDLSRPYRAERLKLLLDEYGSDGTRVFPGGPMSAWAFEEARLAFLNGLFMSCIVMSQVCLEHMLAGLFRMEGRDDLNGAGFAQLTAEADEVGYITSEESELFDRLRKSRNPYVHARSPTAEDHVAQRGGRMNAIPDEVLVADAQAAIITLLGLCRRHPFALDQ